MTIQHLLTHTAGLPREGAFPYWTDHEFPSRDELIAALAEQSTVYPPAETYKYFSLGMAARQEIVRSVSGQEYADYIRENIFAPLGVVVMLNSVDGSPSDFALTALDPVGPTIRDSTVDVEPEPAEDPEWQRLLGLYFDPWGGQYEVLMIDRQLVMYEHNYPPEESAAASLTRLTPVSAGTFKLPDGELVVFERDAMGRVERIRRRYDFLYPVEPRPAVMSNTAQTVDRDDIKTCRGTQHQQRIG